MTEFILKIEEELWIKVEMRLGNIKDDLLDLVTSNGLKYVVLGNWRTDPYSSDLLPR